MEESKNTMSDQPNFPNPILLIIEKFQQIFPQQQKKQESKPDVVSLHSKQSTATTVAAQSNGGDAVSKPPDMVKFSRSHPNVTSPLKLENEECQQNTTPAVMWQVYALGGFIVLKWAWARWNERRAKNDPSNDEPPPQED